MKVLLVDDQTQFVSVLTRRLNMRGIDSVCAFSPDEALKIVETNRFDIAILDITAPERPEHEIYLSYRSRIGS